MPGLGRYRIGTGVEKLRRGRFELADGGTLFLDEIADMSLTTQARVLRAIELGEITRLGSESSRIVNCWVVAATHKNLEREIAEGRFREDLYFRLDVGRIAVPPLRDRRGDVRALCRHFLERACREMGIATPDVREDALRVLEAYDWPGNVRELRNAIERALLLCDREPIELDLLPSRLGARSRPARHDAGSDELSTRYERLEKLERDLVIEALEAASGNTQRAADLLRITRTKLNTRIARYELHELVERLRRADHQG